MNGSSVILKPLKNGSSSCCYRNGISAHSSIIKNIIFVFRLKQYRCTIITEIVKFGGLLRMS